MQLSTTTRFEPIEMKPLESYAKVSNNDTLRFQDLNIEMTFLTITNIMKCSGTHPAYICSSFS